ncbi:hypothetical protein FA15DRAFT_666799 [Coprinopsis marcescibilis]|uniref:Uncharacterized protein n=1 Tax=Coprinopsis marcescibilis TaxID=230819 RepID=A0A5C3L250_COPMA|nr:hypothetical protein FA15DRAFT_666799 [Coprinopsis marcescibilis]
MSFSATLRRTAPGASRSVRPRHDGSQLPPEKLRALVSLYHQSDSFITPENLMSRINEALLFEKGDSLSLGVTLGRRDLERIVAQRQSTPILAQPMAVEKKVYTKRGTWSDLRVWRDKKVVEAIYGMAQTDVDQSLPGLEIVRDGNALPSPEVQESSPESQSLSLEGQEPSPESQGDKSDTSRIP